MVVGIIGAILILGVIVLVHELGHFFAARMSGVGVKRFSVGFGKPIFSIKRGDTIYQMGVLPLGGFCQLEGEDPLELTGAKNEFFSKPPAIRMFIAVAGPLANILLALFIFIIINFVGFKKTYIAGTKIGVLKYISDDSNITSPAYKAGLKTGDEIVKINGKRVYGFDDIRNKVIVSPEKNILLTVRRDSRLIDIKITPALYQSELGPIGKLGIALYFPPIIEGIYTNEQTPAYLVGLKKGDKILAIDEIPILHIYEIPQILHRIGDKTIKIMIERKDKAFYYRASRNIVSAYKDMFKLYHGAYILDEEKLGRYRLNYENWVGTDMLKRGVYYVRSRYAIFYVKPKKVPVYKNTSNTKYTYILGILPPKSKYKSRIVKYSNVFRAVGRAFVMTYNMMGEILRQIGLFIGGKVKNVKKSVAGPVRITYETANIVRHSNIVGILRFIAILSVFIGFFNLFPLPALDGSYIIFGLVELVIRKRINPMVVKYIQNAGFLILIGIAILVIINDISFISHKPIYNPMAGLI